MDELEESEYNIDFDTCSSNQTSQIYDIVLANDTLPSNWAVPLYGFALPVLLLIVMIFNTIIVAILAQRHMRSPTNMILIAISLSDMMTLIAPAPLFFYMYTLGHHKMPLYPVSFCYSWYFFYDIIPNMFHTSSIWLTLALGLQRYIYVCRPHLARIYCSVSKANKVIWCIFSASAIHQSIRFFEFRYEGTCVDINGGTVNACNIYHSSWLVDYLDIYYGSYFWFRFVFVHFTPCMLLIILNILLFRALKAAEKKRAQLLKDNKGRKSSRLRDSNCTTLMLIVILSIFIVTELPLAIITLLHILNSQNYISLFDKEDYHVIQKFFIGSNFFIMLSYPINFAVYCGMSRQFLDTFRKTFLCSNIRGDYAVQEVSTPYNPRSSYTAISMKRGRRESSKLSENLCPALNALNNRYDCDGVKEIQMDILPLKENRSPSTVRFEALPSLPEDHTSLDNNKGSKSVPSTSQNVTFHRSEENNVSNNHVKIKDSMNNKMESIMETDL